MDIDNERVPRVSGNPYWTSLRGRRSATKETSFKAAATLKLIGRRSVPSVWRQPKPALVKCLGPSNKCGKSF